LVGVAGCLAIGLRPKVTKFFCAFLLHKKKILCLAFRC